VEIIEQASQVMKRECTIEVEDPVDQFWAKSTSFFFLSKNANSGISYCTATMNFSRVRSVLTYSMNIRAFSVSGSKINTL
jgi:hypothetical protein